MQRQIKDRRQRSADLTEGGKNICRCRIGVPDRSFGGGGLLCGTLDLAVHLPARLYKSFNDDTAYAQPCAVGQEHRHCAVHGGRSSGFAAHAFFGKSDRDCKADRDLAISGSSERDSDQCELFRVRLTGWNGRSVLYRHGAFKRPYSRERSCDRRAAYGRDLQMLRLYPKSRYNGSDRRHPDDRADSRLFDRQQYA